MVFGDNEGRDVRLTENKHATSVGSSDAFHRVDHHCVGGENAQRDDDEEKDDHNDGGLNDYGESGLCEHSDDLYSNQHEHVAVRGVRGLERAGELLSHVHVYLNGLCSDGDGTDCA